MQPAPSPANVAAAAVAGANAVAPLALPATAAALTVAGAAAGVPGVVAAGAVTELAAAAQPGVGLAANAAAQHALANEQQIPGFAGVPQSQIPLLLGQPSDIGLLDEQGSRTENYIPFRYPDLRDQIIDVSMGS